jgi:NTP pyrophosphatase (non-canonical NTP hydrolase)
MKSYRELEMLVIQWGEARKIVQNSSPEAQWGKTQEEVEELFKAIHSNNREEMIDAYGDILVTLIMGCATADLDLTSCLEHAYNQIKDRKGTLNADGVFVKEA